MSYSKIILNRDIKLSWAYPFTGGEIINDFNDIEPTESNYTLSLPPANVVSTGTNFVINNVGIDDFVLLDNDGIPLPISSIAGGEIRQLYLTDSSTAAGLWQVIPFGGGTSGLVSFSVESLNQSLSVKPGTIIPPSNLNIQFAVSDSLNNLNNLTTQVQNGFLVITGNTPLSYVSRKIGGGTNIDVQSGDGATNDVIINLADSLVGLSSINVGNLSISVNTITTATGSQDINLATVDDGVINLNSTQIDGSGNMTIPGKIINPATAKAYCFFYDNNAASNNIQIESSFNIASVSGAQGSYVITFATPFPDGNYLVLPALSRGTEVIAPFQVFFRSKTATEVIIFTVDTLGNLLPVLDGVSVVVFGN
jgi:hypothetical protein